MQDRPTVTICATIAARSQNPKYRWFLCSRYCFSRHFGFGPFCPARVRSAQVIMHDEYRFLVDCGEGTQRQIMQSGLGFKRLNRILITHGHLDHILGLAGLMSTFLRWEAIDGVEIYAGRWALDRIRDLLYRVVLRGAHPPMKVEFREVQQGVIFEADDFRVSAFPVLPPWAGLLWLSV